MTLGEAGQRTPQPSPSAANESRLPPRCDDRVLTFQCSIKAVLGASALDEELGSHAAGRRVDHGRPRRGVVRDSIPAVALRLGVPGVLRRTQFPWDVSGVPSARVLDVAGPIGLAPRRPSQLEASRPDVLRRNGVAISGASRCPRILAGAVVAITRDGLRGRRRERSHGQDHERRADPSSYPTTSAQRLGLTRKNFRMGIHFHPPVVVVVRCTHVAFRSRCIHRPRARARWGRLRPGARQGSEDAAVAVEIEP